MNETELRTLIQSWENIGLIVRYISDHPEHLDILLKIALNDEQHENWRASWMIDKIHEQHPELVKPYLQDMTKFVLTTKDSSKKRHLLKLISINEIQEKNMVVLLNFCTEVFCNAAEPVAVRVHAMQTLFNIAQKVPDFAGELIDLIEHEIEFHGSAGISSRGKKLLKKLYNFRKASFNSSNLSSFKPSGSVPVCIAINQI